MILYFAFVPVNSPLSSALFISSSDLKSAIISFKTYCAAFNKSGKFALFSVCEFGRFSSSSRFIKQLVISKSKG